MTAEPTAEEAWEHVVEETKLIGTSVQLIDKTQTLLNNGGIDKASVQGLYELQASKISIQTRLDRKAYALGFDHLEGYTLDALLKLARQQDHYFTIPTRASVQEQMLGQRHLPSDVKLKKLFQLASKSLRRRK